jgi:hypothetical protein
MIRMTWLAVDNDMGGIFAPYFYCDHCSDAIDSAAEGLAAWFSDPSGGPGDDATLFTLHRRCNRQFEAGLSMLGRMYWHPLAELPGYLAANLLGSNPHAREDTLRVRL